MHNNALDMDVWSAVPFHFWSATIFILGCGIGSFLNVCIHRMPRGESVVWPPSHCPHCNYRIPWILNLPLVTWLWLRGKCANCGAPISFRYFLVELTTGLVFLSTWLCFGRQYPLVALCYCVMLAGFIVATFIDFEHFIIPDEITLGGTAVGFVLSFLVPAIHHTIKPSAALERSFFGIAVGAGVVYIILRLAKLAFGREKWTLEPDTKVVFGEQGIQFPDHEVPYEELFYRKSDAIVMRAKSVKLGERSWENVSLRLTPTELTVGDEKFDPEGVTNLEAVTSEVVVPREAMGLGDVKFMAAIGAFLGWQATLFSLLFSAVIGSLVGVLFILLRKKEWSSRMPYGPYIALAATFWIFGGETVMNWWLYR